LKRGYLTTDDNTRLSYVDFGGTGRGLLLLHGLFGSAHTWTPTARWLTEHCHVVALDQRGHGWSDKPDDAYERDHFVEDAACVIRQLDLAPAVVIGHSMGALNACVLAARHPDLVRGIVMEDKSVSTDPSTAGKFRAWMASWPQPFPSLADAQSFFRSQGKNYDAYFGEVLVHQPEGWVTQFQPQHMVQCCHGLQRHDHWDDLDRVKCPCLVMRGQLGSCRPDELQVMADRLALGRYVEIAEAGHVIHYDQPEAYRAAVEPFVRELLVGGASS